MRTTVDIEAHLLKRLRLEARRRGVSFKDLLQGLLRRGLEEKRAAAEPYLCPTFSLGSPLPSVDLDKALATAAALEDEEVARKLELRR